MFGLFEETKTRRWPELPVDWPVMAAPHAPMLRCVFRWQTYSGGPATLKAKTLGQNCSPTFQSHEMQRLCEDSLSVIHAAVLPPTCCCGWIRGNGRRRPGTARSFAPGGGPGGNSRSAHVGSSTGTPHSWGPASGGLIETRGRKGTAEEWVIKTEKNEMKYLKKNHILTE